MSSMLRQMVAVARKDIRSELRTRYALNSLAMFVVVTVGAIGFGSGSEKISAIVAGSFVWVAMFFAAVTGLGRSFVSEEERGTSMLLRLTTSASPVYLGKLLVNLLLALATNTLIVLLFLLLMPRVRVAEPLWLVLIVAMLSVGFASALTIVAAIIARAASKGALFPVLSFPLILPMLLIGIEVVSRAFDGTIDETGAENLLLLALYTAALNAVAFLLFDFLWKE